MRIIVRAVVFWQNILKHKRHINWTKITSFNISSLQCHVMHIITDLQ